MPLLGGADNLPDDGEPSLPLLPSPGRDSSRLMQDLLEHKFGDSEIARPPPQFNPMKHHTLPEPSHIHSFIMKTPESLATRPWNTHWGPSSLVVVCQTCRLYMSVTLTLRGEESPKCGSQQSGTVSHHFHIEKWTSNSRYSSSSATVESKPEYGTFVCCLCPVVLEVYFALPVVPDYLIAAVKRRKVGNSSAINNLLNRSNRDAFKSSLPANAFGALSIYVRDILDKREGNRDIYIAPESPFARRVGLDPDMIRFMEYLGWWQKSDSPHLVGPEWDENVEQGRLRRKRLEAVELELAELAQQSSKGLEREQLFGMLSIVLL